MKTELEHVNRGAVAVAAGRQARSTERPGHQPRRPITAAQAREVIRLFLRIMPQLSPENQEKILRQLQATGAAGGNSRATVPPSDGSSDGGGLSRTRLLELIRTLTEFTDKLELMLHQTWGGLAPRSNRRPPRQARELVRNYLTGGDETIEPLLGELRDLQVFAAAVVASIARASDNFAAQFADSRSPSAVREAVESDVEEAGLLARMLKDRDVRCWERYEMLMDGDCQTLVRQEVQRTIVTYVESFLADMDRCRGRGKAPGQTARRPERSRWELPQASIVSEV